MSVKKKPAKRPARAKDPLAGVKATFRSTTDWRAFDTEVRLRIAVDVRDVLIAKLLTPGALKTAGDVRAMVDEAVARTLDDVVDERPAYVPGRGRLRGVVYEDMSRARFYGKTKHETEKLRAWARGRCVPEGTRAALVDVVRLLACGSVGAHPLIETARAAETEHTLKTQAGTPCGALFDCFAAKLGET